MIDPVIVNPNNLQDPRYQIFALLSSIGFGIGFIIYSIIHYVRICHKSKSYQNHKLGTVTAWVYNTDDHMRYPNITVFLSDTNNSKLTFVATKKNKNAVQGLKQGQNVQIHYNNPTDTDFYITSRRPLTHMFLWIFVGCLFIVMGILIHTFPL